MKPLGCRLTSRLLLLVRLVPEARAPEQRDGGDAGPRGPQQRPGHEAPQAGERAARRHPRSGAREEVGACALLEDRPGRRDARARAAALSGEATGEGRRVRTPRRQRGQERGACRWPSWVWQTLVRERVRTCDRRPTWVWQKKTRRVDACALPSDLHLGCGKH